MKQTLYAIVPGETEAEATENAHSTFAELCHTPSQDSGGSVPLFDEYQLQKNIPYGNTESEIYQTSSHHTCEMMDRVWDDMVERLQSLDSQDDPASVPGSIMRSREYIIYDAQARPVLTPAHYDNLIGANTNWVLPARFRW